MHCYEKGLIAGFFDGTINVFHPTTKEIETLCEEGDEYTLNYLTYRHGDLFFALYEGNSNVYDGILKIWNIQTKEPLPSLKISTPGLHLSMCTRNR
jgi:WD40 repeat protein